jgi:hypothetical protein
MDDYAEIRINRLMATPELCRELARSLAVGDELLGSLGIILRLGEALERAGRPSGDPLAAQTRDVADAGERTGAP